MPVGKVGTKISSFQDHHAKESEGQSAASRNQTEEGQSEEERFPVE
jgi:hypothetical protein